MNLSHKILILLVTLTICSSALSAQQNVYVNEESIVTRMMYHLVQQNQLKDVVTGWRVQVLATTDRQRLETVKKEFQRNYPDVVINWKHDKPYYKLQAGAFSTKMNAARLQNRLKREFPSAYPAKDNEMQRRQLLGY